MKQHTLSTGLSACHASFQCLPALVLPCGNHVPDRTRLPPLPNRTPFPAPRRPRSRDETPWKRFRLRSVPEAAIHLRLLRCRGFSLALLNSVEHFMSEMLQAFAIFQAAFRYSRGRLSASPESFNPQSPHPPPDSAAEGQRARGLPLPRAFCSRKYLPVRTRYSCPQVSRRRSCTPQVNCGDTGEEGASRLQSRPALRADSL